MGDGQMRALLLILIVAVLAILIALWTGFLDINQIRGAKAPQISTTDNGVVAKGGQAPAFDVETGSVKVGSGETTVKVQTLEVQPPQNQAQNEVAAATNNGMKLTCRWGCASRGPNELSVALAYAPCAGPGARSRHGGGGAGRRGRDPWRRDCRRNP